MRGLLLLFLLLSFGFAESQTTSNANELALTIRQKMGIPPNDSLLNRTHAERYSLLHGFYDNNLLLSQLDTVAVKKIFDEIERVAEKQNDQDLVREVRYMRLIIQIRNTNRKSRIRLLEHRFDEVKESDQPWEIFIYSWLLGSQLLDTEGKADIGFYLLTEASETLEKGYRHPIEHYLNYILGSAHYLYNDFNGAKKYCGRAFISGKSDTMFYTDGRVFNTLGLVYRKMNLLDSSDIYLNKALITSLDEGDSIMECIISGNLGENQYLRRNYDAAIPLFTKDANMAVANKDTGLASNAFMLLADCYLSKGELDKSWPFLEKGRDYAYKSGQYHRLKILYPILAKWHALKGEPALSALYTDSSMFVVDSLERIWLLMKRH